MSGFLNPTVNVDGIRDVNTNLSNIQRSLSALQSQIGIVTLTIGSIPALTLYGNPGPGAAVPQAISLGTGLTMVGTLLSATLTGCATLPWEGGAIVSAGTFWFCYTAPFALTISGMDWTVGSAGGSFTAAVNIVHAGVATPVIGLSAVNVNSATKTNTAAAGANIALAGDGIQVVISAPAGSPTDAVLCLNFSRN